MKGKIEWENEMKTALIGAQKKYKQVLLDFYNPE